ncbi:MAG: hypothetical protein U1F66_02365 [bacterium]
MSNLRIYVDNSDSSPQLAAPAACESAPPAAPVRGPRPADACSIALPLTLDTTNPPAPRQVVFDRQGDRFVLSPRNSADTLTWVGSHQNLPAVLDVLRVAGSLLRHTGRGAATDRFSLGFNLWIARYLVTGRIVHDDHPQVGQVDLTAMLLEYFSGAGDRLLTPMIGAINMFRREGDLSEGIRERIQQMTSILDLVGPYRAFNQHFFSSQDLRDLLSNAQERFNTYVIVYTFLRRSLLEITQNRPIRYDAEALAASRAYEQLFGPDIAAGRRPNFCSALQAAVRERAGSAEAGDRLMGECQEGMRLGQRPPLEALRDGLFASLVAPSEIPRLQRMITAESARANMTMDWLRRRSSFGSVFGAVLQNISIVAPAGEGGEGRLQFNIAEFQRSLRLMTVLSSRGEYDLSALAFLRRLFGSEGAPPRLRVFYAGSYQELAWQIPEAQLRQIRDLIASLSLRRETSQNFATTGMPVLLGSACALGVGGIVLSHTVPAIQGNRGLQLGLGTASAGLGGGGCLGLAGHYFWPAAVPSAVHNRYAWDLGSSAVGSGIGIATYLLINLLGGPAMNPNARFPADPYGP